MQLDHIKVIKGKVECITGLHIGGSTEGIEIGGVDNPVIKHPITKEPYIPGSSLKGKMRSSLEKSQGTDGEPCKCGKCMICRVFGSSKTTQGPTRIIVRDGRLTPETREKREELLREKGQVYIEQKTENVIDRNKGVALHPRTMERVPSGAMFELEISLQIFDIDKNEEEKIISLVKKGLKMVKETYLGGYGSRGSGQVKFIDLTLDGIPFTLED